MGLFTDERVGLLMEQVASLLNRVDKLEKDARYIADQPKIITDGGFLAWQAAQNAYNNGFLMNEVPINGVVKAIVKHLGMEIEKVAEQTINKPMEVKVVDKPKTTMMGTDGNTGATWVSSHCVSDPMPKPKRKPRRKTK